MILSKEELPVLIPSLLGMLVMFLMAPGDAPAATSQWLYRWQALVGASLALVGAWMTVARIRAQIDQTDRHEQERLTRQHRAVRATLPLTLSHICESLEALLIELDRAKSVVANKSYVSDFDAPLPAHDQIAALTEVVATTDNVTVGEPVAELIREIQMLWARCRVFSNRSEQKRNVGLKMLVNELILQTATTYALTESMFDYARGREENGPSKVDLHQATSLIFRNHLEDQDLNDLISKRLEKSQYCWLRS